MDKLPFRYRLPFDNIPHWQWWRTKPITERSLSYNIKEKLPTAKLWNTGRDSQGNNLSVIAADFDELPTGYRSWDHFFIEAQLSFDNVARSPSGKVKVFFLTAHQGYMDRAWAVDLLREFIGEELLQFADTSFAGLALAYINQSILESLLKAFDGNRFSLPGRAARVESIYSSLSTNCNKLKELGKEEPIPACLGKFVGRGRLAASKERFCRILLSSWNLTTEKGFGLSTRLISEQIGMPVGTVALWLKQLVQMKLLECIDHEWEYRKKAKIYRAKWMLKSAIINIKKNYKPTGESSVIPADGQYYLWALRNLHLGINFLVDTLDTGDIKYYQRVRMFERMIKSKERKQARCKAS